MKTTLVTVLAVTLGTLAFVRVLRWDAHQANAALHHKSERLCECHGGLKSFSPSYSRDPIAECKDGKVYQDVIFSVIDCDFGK
jgi:hypothetical protein